jgi:hypothetical protein
VANTLKQWVSIRDEINDRAIDNDDNRKEDL